VNDLRLLHSTVHNSSVCPIYTSRTFPPQAIAHYISLSLCLPSHSLPLPRHLLHMLRLPLRMLQLRHWQPKYPHVWFVGNGKAGEKWLG
jgi:hypothetical protein